jgi:two-component system cell cycle sensor histidine kinase/response regulator CckA
VIDAGPTSAELLAAVVAVQRQFISAPDSPQAFAQALRWLVESTESEFGFIAEAVPVERGKFQLKLHATTGQSNAAAPRSSANGNGNATLADNELHAFSQLPDEVIRSKSIVIRNALDPAESRNGAATSPSVMSFCGLPLLQNDGAMIGIVGLANRQSGYEQDSARTLRPMCDALAEMIAAASRNSTQRSKFNTLRASEARLRIFADHVSDGLFLQDEQTRVIDVNRQACESLGYNRNELLGQTPLDFDSIATPEMLSGLQQRLKAEGMISFDSRHRRKDGSEFPVEIRVRPLWIYGKFHTLALVGDITERKHAEERLHESEQRLQLALNASKMGVWEWNFETDKSYLSPECLAIYGDIPFDGTGTSFNQNIHPEDFPKLADKIRPLMDSDSSGYWEYRILSPTYGIRWIANWGLVRRDASGKPLKLIGTTRDITEEKEAAEALRQSNLLLENVVENIPLAVFVKDPQDSFRIRLWNKAAESIFGIQREAMIGRTAYDYWPKEQAESYDAVDQSVINSRILQDMSEVSSVHASGNPVILHTRKLPLFDSNGKPSLLLGISDDITERKRSEEALRQAQQRLAFTLHGANVGLWDWDLATNEVIFSEEWKSQLGYQGGEIQNRAEDWETRVHPSDLEHALQHIQDAIEGRTQEYEAEFRMQHKDGSWRWILSRGSVIRDAKHSPVRMLGIHIDITDRKRVEEALQASESRYRCFVDHATDALFLQDKNARVVDVNEQACTSLGYSREELIGMSPVDFDPDVSEKSIANTLDRLQAGETVAFDSRHQRKDGTTFPVEIRLRPFFSNNERFHIAFVRDITERKRSEEALRQSESRLRTLLENLDKVAVQAYEPDGTVTFWNHASELFYGYAAKDAIGKDIVELLHGEHTRGAERRIMSESLRTGKPPGAEEVEVVRADGSKITVFASRVVHPRPGKSPEFFCFDVDITEKKRAEEELARRQAELLHASRLSTVGQMVAEISHEVAQPLNAIGNFAAASVRILDGDVTTKLDTLHEYVAAILKQNERCVAILDRLRDFIRRTPTKHVPCDVPALLHESAELVSHDFRRNRVVARFDLPEQLPPVTGDRVQLQQLFVNLLTNARDAVLEQAKDRRTISIKARAERDALIVEVSDLGAGLTDDAAIHLFDPFFTTKEHGMGIGLSICQSIVVDHGGKIEALPNQYGDVGTTFRVRLPFSGKRRP